MAQFPQLPLWTDSYLADTTHLTTIEHGAYLLLLIAAWRSPGCRLPDDDKLLRRFAGSPKNWRRIKPKVLSFWLLKDGYLTQKRLCQEYERAAHRAQIAATAAHAKHLKYNNTTTNRAGSEQAPSTATTTIKESKKDLSSFSVTTSEQVQPVDKRAPPPGLLATAPLDSALARPAYATKVAKELSSKPFTRAELGKPLIEPPPKRANHQAPYAQRALADLEARKAARRAFEEMKSGNTEH